MTNRRPNENSPYYKDLTSRYNGYKVPIGTPVLQHWIGGESIYNFLLDKKVPLLNKDVYVGEMFCEVLYYNSGMTDPTLSVKHGIGNGKLVFVIFCSRDTYDIEEGMVIEESRIIPRK